MADPIAKTMVLRERVGSKFVSIAVLCLLVSGVTAVPASAAEPPAYSVSAQKWAEKYGIELNKQPGAFGSTHHAALIGELGRLWGRTPTHVTTERYELSIPDAVIAKLKYDELTDGFAPASSDAELVQDELPTGFVAIDTWIRDVSPKTLHENGKTIVWVDVTSAVLTAPKSGTTPSNDRPALLIQACNVGDHGTELGLPVGKVLCLSPRPEFPTHEELVLGWKHVPVINQVVKHWGWLLLVVLCIVAVLVVVFFPAALAAVGAGAASVKAALSSAAVAQVVTTVSVVVISNTILRMAQA